MRAEDRRVDDVYAGFALLLGELDDQYAVLRGKCDQNDEADLCIKIERQSRDDDAEKRPEDADSNRQQDGNRNDPAFVKRNQKEIGEENSKRQYDARLPCRFVFLIGRAALAREKS